MLCVAAAAAAFGLALAGLATRARGGLLARRAIWAVRAGFCLLSLALVAFLVDGGALSSPRGGLLAFSWVAAAAYMFCGCTPRYALVGLVVLPVLVAAPLIALFDSPRAADPATDLPAGLLVVHLTGILVGFAGGLLAGGLSVAYAVSEAQLKRHRTSLAGGGRAGLAALDRNALRALAVAWPALTVGLAAGIGPARADGTDLDATMVFSTLVWALYGLVLALRVGAGWRGRRAAGLLVAGAAATLVVSLGLTGVHVGG